MDQATADVIKSVVPALTGALGIWLGSHLSLRNSLRALQTQSEQRAQELQREREIKEQETLKAWFEDFAITNCIDPLLLEILRLQDITIRSSLKVMGNVEIEVSPVPTEAFGKLFTLTGSIQFSTLSNALRLAPAGGLAKDECQEYVNRLNTLFLYLVRLKQYLLTTDISAKSDIYNICNIDRIRTIGESIDELINEILKREPNNELSPMTLLLRNMGKYPSGTPIE